MFAITQRLFKWLWTIGIILRVSLCELRKYFFQSSVLTETMHLDHIWDTSNYKSVMSMFWTDGWVHASIMQCIHLFAKLLTFGKYLSQNNDVPAAAHLILKIMAMVVIGAIKFKYAQNISLVGPLPVHWITTITTITTITIILGILTTM